MTKNEFFNYLFWTDFECPDTTFTITDNSLIGISEDGSVSPASFYLGKQGGLYICYEDTKINLPYKDDLAHTPLVKNKVTFLWSDELPEQLPKLLEKQKALYKNYKNLAKNAKIRMDKFQKLVDENPELLI